MNQYLNLSNNNNKENILSKAFYYLGKGLIEQRNRIMARKLLAVYELNEEPENKTKFIKQ